MRPGLLPAVADWISMGDFMKLFVVLLTGSVALGRNQQNRASDLMRDLGRNNDNNLFTNNNREAGSGRLPHSKRRWQIVPSPPPGALVVPQQSQMREVNRFWQHITKPLGWGRAAAACVVKAGEGHTTHRETHKHIYIQACSLMQTQLEAQVQHRELKPTNTLSDCSNESFIAATFITSQLSRLI